MAKFKCDGSAMQSALQDVEQIQEILESAYAIGEDVLGNVQGKNGWTGEAQKTMEAFLDLLLQYHSALGEGGNSPVAQAVEALEELQNNLGKFYDSWPEWEELKSI